MMIDNKLPDIAPIEGIIGRPWDISKPLLQVCKLLKPDRFEELKQEIMGIAKEKIYEKKETIQWEIIKALYELSPNSGLNWTIPMESLLEEVNRTRNDDQKLTSQAVGKKVSAMGLTTKHVRGHSFINLTRTELDNYMKEYGVYALQKRVAVVSHIGKTIEDLLNDL